ncbi:MAG: hypothetical protein AAF004_12825, partial [Pseudomonadota bacterium]
MTDTAARLSTIFPALAVALGTLIFVCLGAIMYFFMGGNDSNALGLTLHAVQLLGAIAGAAIILVSLWFFLVSDNSGWRGLYDYTPRWLIFFALMVYTIVAVGELSFLVLSRYVSTAGNGALHVSLICLLITPTALAMLVAVWRRHSGGA